MLARPWCGTQETLSSIYETRDISLLVEQISADYRPHLWCLIRGVGEVDCRLRRGLDNEGVWSLCSSPFCGCADLLPFRPDRSARVPRGREARTASGPNLGPKAVHRWQPRLRNRDVAAPESTAPAEACASCARFVAESGLYRSRRRFPCVVQLPIPAPTWTGSWP